MGRWHAADHAEEDVLLNLRSSEHLLALPLHSRVLAARSEFFASRLSQRWDSPPASNGNNLELHELSNGLHDPSNGLHDDSDDKPEPSDDCDVIHMHHHDGNLCKVNLKPTGLRPINITIPADGASAAAYKKCVELMYVPGNCLNSCRPFCGVEDALSVLRVAAELLFHDCVDACMEYLEMLPVWTDKEEASIHGVLTSLQLPHINVDLAARLSLPQGILPHQPMNVMRGVLINVLQSASDKLPVPLRAVKSMDPSKPIPEALIFLLWKSNLNVVKASLYDNSVTQVQTICGNLSWLLAKLLDLEVADRVVKAWTADSELASAMTRHRAFPSSCCPMLPLLELVSRAVLNGRVLLSRSARFVFLTTWRPVAIKLPYSMVASGSSVRQVFSMLLTSLPVLDRERIYKDLESHDLSLSFGPWCQNLRQMHLQHGERHEALLAMEADE